MRKFRIYCDSSLTDEWSKYGKLYREAIYSLEVRYRGALGLSRTEYVEDEIDKGLESYLGELPSFDEVENALVNNFEDLCEHLHLSDDELWPEYEDEDDEANESRRRRIQSRLRGLNEARLLRRRR